MYVTGKNRIAKLGDPLAGGEGCLNNSSEQRCLNGSRNRTFVQMESGMRFPGDETFDHNGDIAPAWINRLCDCSAARLSI
jgi:hypothetical protein